ncbi:hypothetical protein [Bradyrhizobium nanningense]|uniref:hypothetical protein n=1 Tax=Bradyrhizobium nanningense TaxID=1325118 RepID=UPI001FDEFFDF|nr:hypothetical protein [Bradyrhizobium nanningense]
MPEFDAAIWFLAATTFFAAFVNGAIGYGFSSLTVPFALVFYTNRILNPAIVIIEVFVNGLAPPYRSKLADRPAVRVDAGRSLFADDNLRASHSDAV